MDVGYMEVYKSNFQKKFLLYSAFSEDLVTTVIFVGLQLLRKPTFLIEMWSTFCFVGVKLIKPVKKLPWV